MLKYLLLIGLIFSPFVISETVEFDKKFALKVLVASYVNGFKEFDTTVVGHDDRVSIGIYVDSEVQSRERASHLANRFREQVPKLLELNSWAKDIKVIVNVY